MSRKFEYSIVYRDRDKRGNKFCREALITARSRKMAIRELEKDLGKGFEYNICKSLD